MDKIKVIFNLDRRHHRSWKAYKKVQYMRKRQKIRESDPGQEKKYGQKKKPSHRRFFIAIKSGSDEQPDLIQDHRRSQNDADIDAQFDQQTQVISWPGVHQLRIQVMRR